MTNTAVSASFSQMKSIMNSGSPVSYTHLDVYKRQEENSAEAEELGDLLKVVGLASVYCYDGDDWAGGWNKDYDILVMVGDPSAADNPIYVGAGPEGESK